MTEYRNKGQATDIHVRSGVGTKVRDEQAGRQLAQDSVTYDVNRVPSVNLKF